MVWQRAYGGLMLRLASAIAVVLFLSLALLPFPTTAPSHAEPSGAHDFYLSGVLQQSTGNATVTPTPNPTTTPSGVVAVRDNHSWYFNDQLDTYFVVGEVENGRSAPVALIELLITFYDEGNNAVYSDTIFVKGEQLVPREKSCFLLLADGLTTSWSYYEISEPTFFEYTNNVPTLLAQNVTGEVVEYDTYEEYEVRGTVRNQSSAEVPFAEMVGTLYNSQGKVVDCGFAWEYDIPPSGSESFSMEYSFRTVYSGIVDSLRILPTGNFGNRPARSPAAQDAYERYKTEQERERR